MKKQSNVKSMKVVAEIAKERCDQSAKHGWTREHDDEHSNGDIALAAAAYAIATVNERKASVILPLNWRPKFKDEARRNLVIAGALIVAEIERLDRIATTKEQADDRVDHMVRTPAKQPKQE